MKVKSLIEALQKFDPETEVGVLHDNGVMQATEVGLYTGEFQAGAGNKMILVAQTRPFVVVGNPGNYEEPAFHDKCKPVQVFEDFGEATPPQEVVRWSYDPWKPPFTYNFEGQWIEDSNGERLLDLRGWGFLTGQGGKALGWMEARAARCQDAVGKHVAELMTRDAVSYAL
jgi:hypothetical protein